MLCRSCGTEIADKAIVCYRCGAATTDPVRKPVEIRPRRSIVPWLSAALIMLLAAIGIRAFAPEAPDSPWLTVSIILAGAAGIIIVLGLIRRR